MAVLLCQRGCSEIPSLPCVSDERVHPEWMPFALPYSTDCSIQINRVNADHQFIPSSIAESLESLPLRSKITSALTENACSCTVNHLWCFYSFPDAGFRELLIPELCWTFWSPCRAQDDGLIWLRTTNSDMWPFGCKCQSSFKISWDFRLGEQLVSWRQVNWLPL